MGFDSDERVLDTTTLFGSGPYYLIVMHRVQLSWAGLGSERRWQTMMSQREAGFVITQIHHLGRRVFTEMMKRRGIDIGPGQGRILFALWQQDGVPINELSKKTLLRKSTLSELLDNLEQAGYIRREQSEEDRRKVRIHLTDKTHTLQKAYIQLSKEMTELFYKGFTPEEMDEFEDYLRRVLDNLVSFESQ
ncbi:MAG: MarR family winged helix-turn-helix transcriptional regulator [Candidatus Thorarchaeota archaeon]